MSFGLGDCDEDLVMKIAYAGRGTHTIAKDKSNTLNGDVVRALGSAMEPMLCDTQFGFNGQMSDQMDYKRNYLITAMKLMPVEQLEEIKFQF